MTSSLSERRCSTACVLLIAVGKLTQWGADAPIVLARALPKRNLSFVNRILVPMTLPLSRAPPVEKHTNRILSVFFMIYLLDEIKEVLLFTYLVILQPVLPFVKSYFLPLSSSKLKYDEAS